ncbi:MAG: DEAD/DEAH box helicase [Marinifilaceae bacterium]|jgi:ATP-dependent RNA helicase RhlE|nr:DEAD/DEAH box helicase [Marinifilaceae bacterium]
MISFDDIKLSKQIRNSIDEAGFEKPTEIQHRVFSPIKSGQDIIGIAQTGTGKTMAYLAPLLMKLNYAQGMDPRAIIVVPTRELVLQVCESIDLLTTYMDIRAVGVFGGVNINTQKDKVFEGVDILVATPGRLMDIFMTGVVRFNQVKTLVLDEADKMLDLGFQAQLKAIFDVLPQKYQKLLFSATFSDVVEKLSDEFLLNPKRIEVAPQATTVENITQLRYDVPNFLSKIEMLKYLLADKEIFKRVIVFTETKKTADRVSDRMEEFLGEDLSIIHSNKAQNTRIKALNNFKEAKTRILIASDVAARGLDIKDISHVINFDIPSNYVEYVHRIGRTARAEKDGTAISLVKEDELELVEKIEELIGKSINLEAIPVDVELTDMLLEDEKVQTRNIKLKSGVKRNANAFHEKSAKNKKKNSGSMRKRKEEKQRIDKIKKKHKNKRRK